jgi:hypothetical protein
MGSINNIHSERCLNPPKSSGGCPSILTNSDINYAKCVICTGKVENAVQAAGMPCHHTQALFSTQTLCHGLKKNGMVPIVKKKHPKLSPRHRKARLDFTERHQEWTIEDWKKVIWSDKIKINCFGVGYKTFQCLAVLYDVNEIQNMVRFPCDFAQLQIRYQCTSLIIFRSFYNLYHIL